MTFLSPYRLPELGVQADEVAAAVLSPVGWRTVSLPELEPLMVHDFPLYTTTGVFPNLGTPEWEDQNRSRKAENMTGVWALCFDVDINNYVGVSKAAILRWDPHDLRDAANDMATEVEKAFVSIGMEPYLTVYSGFGCYFYFAVAPDVRAMRPELQALQRRAAAAMDQVWPGLIEKNTLDPGTRLSRVVGSLNVKGRSPIDVEQIGGHSEIEYVHADHLVLGEVPYLVSVTVPRERPVIEDRRQAVIDYVSELWTEGRRHALALALSAMMAKEGVPLYEAAQLVREIAGDDDEGFDRMRAVSSTYQRLEKGQPVSGWYGAGDVLLGSERDALGSLVRSLVREVGHIDFINPVADDWGDVYGTGVRDGGGAGAPPEDPPGHAFAGLPEEAVYGWIKRYVELMSPTTEAPEAFHLGVGLTVAGAFLGRSASVMYGSDQLFPNLYTMLVGASGKTRKDSSIRRGISMLRAPQSALGRISTPPVSVLRDIGSAEGLLAYLAEHPSTLLHISELSRLMGNVKREVTRTISPTLMEAWDCPPVMSSQTKTPTVATNPVLSALAAVQPDVLADLMTDSDIHSGFANRWLYICGVGGEPKPWPVAVDAQKLSFLLEVLTSARDRAVALNQPLTLEKEAYDVWEHWYLDQFQVGGTSEELAMQQRLPVMAVKIALILSVLDGGSTISSAALRAGTAIADWSWQNLRPLLGEWGGSVENRIHTRVVNVLSAVPGSSVGRAELQRSVSSRRWSVLDFNKVLSAMETSRIVHYDKTGRVQLLPMGS